MFSTLKRAASEVVLFALDKRHREFRRQRGLIGPAIRDEAARQFAKKLPKSGGALDPSGHEDLQSLERNGWLPLDGIVSASQARDMLEYAKRKTAYDPYMPRKVEFAVPHGVPADTHVAHHLPRDVVMAPHALAIANNPNVLALVEGYLGAKPTISSMRMWWSTPTPAGEAANAELFHRDVDDLRFLKLFVYLTDVGPENGPHLYVEGSQGSENLVDIRRYQDDEVAEAFGVDVQRVITGQAGTAFIENTYGIHRGIPPAVGERLLFQVQYSLRPLIFGPRRPVARHAEVGGNLDPYINRVLLA